MFAFHHGTKIDSTLRADCIKCRENTISRSRPDGSPHCGVTLAAEARGLRVARKGIKPVLMRRHIGTRQVYNFVDTALDGDMHAKRVESLAIATHGVIQAGSLAVTSIGRAVAVARGTKSKHAIKQMDRLLSNRGIELASFFEHWVPYILAERTEPTSSRRWR